jgi:high affinity Mn2+ porin
MHRNAVLGAVLFLAISEGLPAMAADRLDPQSAEAADPTYGRWQGPYIGGHFGYGGGTFGAGTNPIKNQAAFFPSTATGFNAGYQVGYNFQLHNNVVVGFEGDVTFVGPKDQKATGLAAFNTTVDYFATARARLGYAFGNFLPYVTGGAVWGQSKVDINDSEGNAIAAKSAPHFGWVAGAGVEYAIDRHWSTNIEYNYIDLATQSYNLGNIAPAIFPVDPRLHIVKLGLNYKLDGGASKTTFAPTPPESNNWNIHGQTTFIQQGYPSFRSPYEGAKSLPGVGLGRETWTVTAFLGWRLWEGGEFYFNPELAQGFGIGSTLGLAGFSNGEAQKGGGLFPKIRAQRYFFRQVFGLGGEQEDVEDGPNQLAGKRDVDRVTLTVGRFAVGDIFDANSYAHDPRADFMNWALWASAAYDFPADLPGFTRGVVVELNRKDWALRGGLFQVPEEPNSDVLVFKTGGAVIEFEQRYQILNEAGKLRLGVFANRGQTGNYRQALAIATADPTADINDVMQGIRRQRPKYGFYANAEQAINKDIGVFARASWNDGQNEILSFTDIDRSLSGGVSIKGSSWNRPNDTIGLGAAINGLSGAHRDFLAAGGLGLLIGDGALNYSPEEIIESYYAYNIAKGATLTFDYQFINNPAYNADRGPVHIFSGRFHAEF